MFKYAEMLMAEEDDKVCELILKQQDNLILKINDRFHKNNFRSFVVQKDIFMHDLPEFAPGRGYK